MPRIPSKKIRDLLAQGDVAATTTAKGRALEDALKFLFGKVPGVRFLRANAVVRQGSEEIDIIFWNEKLPNGLPFLPNILLFECKNWSQPVDSASVSYFCNKVASRHREYGFLIAANGITGDEQDRTAAYQQISVTFLQRNTHIILFDRAEITAIKSTEQLIEQIQEKIADIILQA